MEEGCIKVILKLNGVKSESVPRCGGGRGEVQWGSKESQGKSEEAGERECDQGRIYVLYFVSQQRQKELSI